MINNKMVKTLKLLLTIAELARMGMGRGKRFKGVQKDDFIELNSILLLLQCSLRVWLNRLIIRYREVFLRELILHLKEWNL